MLKILPILSCLLFWVSMQAFADDQAYYQQKHLNECGTTYHAGQSPLPIKKDLKIYYQCFNGFAVGYLATGRIALWSAEHLTAERLRQAETLERKDNFHEESQLPDKVRATLDDYKNTPYDRGHLAPNADMATPEQQYDSFSLANIVPQNAENNRKIWRGIESRTRYLTLQYKEVYVVTGTAFLGNNFKKMHQRVLIPTHLYKAIYIPSINQAGVYFVPNNDSGLIEVISLDELATRIQTDVMPNVDPSVQSIAMPLPTDTLDFDEHQTKKPITEKYSVWVFLINLLLSILEWLLKLLKN